MTREELAQEIHSELNTSYGKAWANRNDKGMDSAVHSVMNLIDTYTKAKVEERQSLLLSARKVVFTEEEVQAKVLEARMIGLLEAESLFVDDPNPDAVRRLSSPQQLKLRKHIAALQAEKEKLDAIL